MPPWLIRRSKFKLIQTLNSSVLVTAFVNVNGRDRVLNPGPLSRRPDKSTTTPRSATKI